MSSSGEGVCGLRLLSHSLVRSYRSFRRIRKFVSGVSTVLYEDDVGFTAGSESQIVTLTVLEALDRSFTDLSLATRTSRSTRVGCHSRFSHKGGRFFVSRASSQATGVVAVRDRSANRPYGRELYFAVAGAAGSFELERLDAVSHVVCASAFAAVSVASSFHPRRSSTRACP